MSVTPQGTLLTISGVTLRFGGQVALDAVDLTLDGGEILGLVGPNGSGKTSLCNVISGIYRPQSGSVRIAREELIGKSPHVIAALGVARTFQGAEVLRDLTVLENVLIGRERMWQSGLWAVLARTPMSRRETTRHVRVCREALELVGLEDAAEKTAVDLPFGRRKLVELARCVAMEPRIILLDEPTSGMRPDEKDEVVSVIRRLSAQRDLGIMLIEHDVHLVRSIAPRTVVLDFGRKIADGPSDVVFREASVRSVYMGES